MKIINLPTTVGGNPQGISFHLNKIGLKSCSWTLSQNKLNYVADKVVWSEGDNVVQRELKRLLALLYVFQFDAIFFNYGSGLYSARQNTTNINKGSFKRVSDFIYSKYCSFFQHLEVGLLKLLKKPILIQYQGDDARQGDYCLANFDISPATEVSVGYYTSTSDQFKRQQIQFYAERCSKIYALNPDLLHVLPPNAEFLPYSNISLEAWQPDYTQLQARPLKIGHAPTNREVKGTAFVLAALDSLKKKNLQFELVLIEGHSHADAKEMLKSIDVFVDQLFCGWYGGVAVEAMALGKPVLAYIREQDLVFIPNEMKADLPIINVNSITVESELQRVIEMARGDLYDLALRSRKYVERWHDPIEIALRIKRDIELAKQANR